MSVDDVKPWGWYSSCGADGYGYSVAETPTETAVAWVAGTVYAVGEIVTDSSVVYRCIAVTTSTDVTPPASDATHWTAATSWVSGSVYAVGALVYNSSGNYFVCTTATTSSETTDPASDTAHWTAAGVSYITVCPTNGGMMRIPLGTNVGSVIVDLPVPRSNRTCDIVLRYTIGTCVPSFTFTMTDGNTLKTLNRLDISGDDDEASANMMKLITCYPSATTGYDYDLTVTTRKLGE